MEQTETFRMLSDQTRLRALALVAAQGELCVCELVASLDLSQPMISRHLAALRDSGLITSRRDAQWVFHGLSNNLADWQRQVIDGALDGIKDEPVVLQDTKRLNNMKNRPQRCSAA